MNEELPPTQNDAAISREEFGLLNKDLRQGNNHTKETVKELEELDNDLNIFLNCTDAAIMFVSTNCCIRGITQTARDLLHIQSNDLGRPIGDLHDFPMTGPAFLSDIKQALNTLQPVEIRYWFTSSIFPSAGQVESCIDQLPVTSGKRAVRSSAIRQGFIEIHPLPSPLR